MEPIPERIPDVGLEGGQIGNQDNHDGFVVRYDFLCY